MILVTNNEGTLGVPTTAHMLAEGAHALDAIEATVHDPAYLDRLRDPRELAAALELSFLRRLPGWAVRWARLSSAELQADQPIESRKMSASPAAATNLPCVMRGRNAQ